MADLYHMVNVPQAVWIDETGHIVRPTESAGAYEGFRAMDRTTRKVPDEVAAVTSQAKRTYIDAVRDWVIRGARASTPSSREAALPICPCPTKPSRGRTRTFAWGSTCSGAGKLPPPQAQFDEARRLHPDSWNIWRQTAAVDERGLAAGPEFWARVDALGSRRYYAPVDMEGMPD